MSCLHGMQPEWCAICRGDVRAIPQGKRSQAQNANGAVACTKLVDLLIRIRAKTSVRIEEGKRTCYTVYFHKRYAESVGALTDCVVSNLSNYYVSISCKDAVMELEERRKAA